MRSATRLFLDYPEARWAKAYLWLAMTTIDVREWCARWVFAQHNAKVIVNFEERMVSVIYAASGGMMSKPYYTTEAMLQCIEENERKLYDYAYADGREDLAAELGVDDPSPVEPE